MRRRTLLHTTGVALAFSLVVGVLVADGRSPAAASMVASGPAVPAQASDSSSIVSLVPARVFESRAAVTVDGRFSNVGRVAAGATVEVPLLGRGGVPRRVWVRWWRM